MAWEEGEEIDFNTSIESDAEGNIILVENEDHEEEEFEEEETPGEEEEEEPEQEQEEEEEDPNPEQEQEEEQEEEEEPTNSFEPFEAEINGEKISVDSAEEARLLIQNLSKPKIQQPNVWEQAQKELGVTTKDLALIAAIKGGDKDALLFAASQGGLDISQLIYDETPTSFDKDFTVKQLNEGELIMQEIQSSNEMEAFSSMINSTDEDFIHNLSDVKNLQAFRKQVASGKAQEIMPLAKKRAMLEGTTLFEAYAKVGHELASKQTEDKGKGKEDKSSETNKKPPVKKAKSQKQSKSSNKEPSEEDIWNMPDDEFNAKYGKRTI